LVFGLHPQGAFGCTSTVLFVDLGFRGEEATIESKSAASLRISVLASLSLSPRNPPCGNRIRFASTALDQLRETSGLFSLSDHWPSTGVSSLAGVAIWWWRTQ
jgi:hypothetical protein